jgi:ABC-type transport system involved in cytochrome c biogenesis ATPase subunit
LPTKSIVYFSGSDIEQNILYEKPFAGGILYNNLPIFHCRKSFLTKILCQIAIDKMFAKRLTVLENLKIYAEICGSQLITNAPIKYFEIQENVLHKKVCDVENDIINLLEFGLLFYFRQPVCMVSNITKNLATNEKVLHLIQTRINNSSDSLFHTGHRLEIESCITLHI